MGNAFSSLSACIGRRTSLARHQMSSLIENMEEDVVSVKYRNSSDASDIQIEDCPDGSELQFDENQEDDVVFRGESMPSSATKCTYNVYVNNGGNVVNGDNNKIFFQSEQLVQKLRMDKAADGFAFVVPGDVDEEAQISPQTVDKNITVYDPDMMIIGDGNLIYPFIYVQQDDFCQDEASNSEQSARTRLFPLQSEPLVLPLPGVEKGHKKLFDRMGGIVNQLYPLRDSGKMLEFEEAFNRLHLRYSIHPAIKSFLLLEESANLTYEKNFKEAKRKAEESLNIVNNGANGITGALQDVLTILANIALAKIFRRKKKLGKASICLENAKERSKQLTRINLPLPNLALAHLDYEQARYKTEFATVASKSENLNKEARELLGRCIDRFRALSDGNHLYTAKQTFALLCLARLSLPTARGNAEPGQHRRLVKKQCTRQAENYLEEYQRSHSDSPVVAKVMYFMTSSKLCFLKKNYALAKDFGCQALDIAEKYDLKVEIVPAQNYVEQISRYCSSTKRQNKLQKLTNLSSSYSSSLTATDSNSDQKYSSTNSQRAA